MKQAEALAIRTGVDQVIPPATHAGSVVTPVVGYSPDVNPVIDGIALDAIGRPAARGLRGLAEDTLEARAELLRCTPSCSRTWHPTRCAASPARSAPRTRRRPCTPRSSRPAKPTSLRELGVAEADLDRAAVPLAGTPDPRLRELLQDLVRRLRAFAIDNDLSQEESQHGIDFLTRTGQICDTARGRGCPAVR